MESVARMVALIAGIAIVLLTAWSVFTALVVPRVTSSPAMRMLARALGGSARRIAPKLPNYETRDRVLSFVGPAAMVLLFIIWLCLIVLGVALIEWYAAGVDFATALGISGSSVFTLGIVSSGDAGPRVGRGRCRRHRSAGRCAGDRLSADALHPVLDPRDRGDTAGGAVRESGLGT